MASEHSAEAGERAAAKRKIEDSLSSTEQSANGKAKVGAEQFYKHYYSKRDDAGTSAYHANYTDKGILPEHEYEMVTSILRSIDRQKQQDGSILSTVKILDFGCGDGRQSQAAEKVAKLLRDPKYYRDIAGLASPIKVELVAVDVSQVGLDRFGEKLSSKGYKKTTESNQSYKKKNLSFKFVKTNETDTAEQVKAKAGDNFTAAWSFFGPLCYITDEQNRRSYIKMFQEVAKHEVLYTVAGPKLMEDEQAILADLKLSLPDKKRILEEEIEALSQAPKAKKDKNHLKQLEEKRHELALTESRITEINKLPENVIIYSRDMDKVGEKYTEYLIYPNAATVARDVNPSNDDRISEAVCVRCSNQTIEKNLLRDVRQQLQDAIYSAEASRSVLSEKGLDSFKAKDQRHACYFLVNAPGNSVNPTKYKTSITTEGPLTEKYALEFRARQRAQIIEVFSGSEQLQQQQRQLLKQFDALYETKKIERSGSGSSDGSDNEISSREQGGIKAKHRKRSSSKRRDNDEAAATTTTHQDASEIPRHSTSKGTGDKDTDPNSSRHHSRPPHTSVTGTRRGGGAAAEEAGVSTTELPTSSPSSTRHHGSGSKQHRSRGGGASSGRSRLPSSDNHRATQAQAHHS